MSEAEWLRNPHHRAVELLAILDTREISLPDSRDGHRVRTLADLRPFVSDGVVWTGPPRWDGDPRLAAVREVAKETGVSDSEIDRRVLSHAAMVGRMASLARMTLGRRRQQMSLPLAAPAEMSTDPIARDDDEPIDDVPAPDGPPPEDLEANEVDLEFADTLAQHEQHERDMVRTALAGVARLRGVYDLTVAEDLLVGAKTGCLEHEGLDSVKTFGALRDRGRAWIRELLRRCSEAGLIDGIELSTSGRSLLLDDDGDLAFGLPLREDQDEIKWGGS